jgi:hypothetical protein
MHFCHLVKFPCIRIRDSFLVGICTHFQLILVKSLKGHLQFLERTLQNVGLESCEVLMFVCSQRRLMLQFAIMHSAFSQPSFLLLAVVSYYYPFCDKSLRVASSCHSNFPESFFLVTCSLALLEMELITTKCRPRCGKNQRIADHPAQSETE